MYDAAMDTMKSIGSHDIEEMRSYRDPPIGVKFVADMLCEMFDKPARYVLISNRFKNSMGVFSITQ